MSVARHEVVDPLSIQILHVYNRCVRRAFLCGVDSVSGQDYSHRKDWIRSRLEFLTGIFAFDIATYAVMSNHFHLVVRSRPDIVADWSDEEVAIRNMRLQGKTWFRSDGSLRKSAVNEIARIVDDPDEILRMRRKLSDVSKLMLYFDRNLAVRANREDQVSGAFWEGTFKAELIEDEASLLACMAYVDLNPIRALMAATLEESEYTGASDRLSQLRQDLAVGQLEARKNQKVKSTDSDSAEAETGDLNDTLPPLSKSSLEEWERKDHPLIGWLAPIYLDEQQPGSEQDFSGRRPSCQGFLPLSLVAYLELVDWAGRQIVPQKQGAISRGAPPILRKLGIKSRGFVESIQTHAQRDRYLAATERSGVPAQSFTAQPASKPA